MPDNEHIWLDVDRAMWYGPGVPDVHLPRQQEPLANRSTQPQVPTTEPLPRTTPPRFPMLVQRFPPPWQAPSPFSSPSDTMRAVCVPWYADWATVVSIEAQPTRLIILRGISYEIDQLSVANGEVFEIRIVRGGIEMARWRDMVVDNAQANPAHRYLFAGHTYELPITLRVDKNESLVIQFRILGTMPFVRTDSDPFGGEVKVILNGWVPMLRDTRDGAPKFMVDGVADGRDSEQELMLSLTTHMYARMKGKVHGNPR